MPVGEQLAPQHHVAPKAAEGSVTQGNIPAALLNNDVLNKRIGEALPANYKFEIHKCLWRIEALKAQHVALQFPEGLLMFATTIADILEEYVIVLCK